MFIVANISNIAYYIQIKHVIFLNYFNINFKTLKMNALEIKTNRKKLGLNQDELAKRLGVSVKTISNYENGEVIPESKKELLHKILNETEEIVLKEPPSDYNEEKNIIEQLKLEIKLKDKIIQLQEEKIELILKSENKDS